MIHPQSNYYLFKRGIKPAWEDAANTKGGKWSIQLPRGKFGDTVRSLSAPSRNHSDFLPATDR